MSLLFYEIVIFKEAYKIRKFFVKIINEEYIIMKGYQNKLKRGLISIKILLALKSSKKTNKKNDNSDLQTFLIPKELPISSFNRKKKNHEI